MYYIFLILLIILLNYKQKTSTINQKLDKKIPKILNKIFIDDSMELPKVLGQEIKECHDKWKELNPDYNVRFWSGNECRNYLSKYFGKRYLDCFDNINAYAGKCNFFRYCVVYNEGGWYSDWKQFPYESLNNIVKNHENIEWVSCYDHGHPWVKKMGCMQNALF